MVFDFGKRYAFETVKAIIGALAATKAEHEVGVVQKPENMSVDDFRGRGSDHRVDHNL